MTYYIFNCIISFVRVGIHLIVENVMGYTKRPGTKITDYLPDDTENTFYMLSDGCSTLCDIFEKAQKKWPGITLDEIEIGAENIQTQCIGYDLYDSSDYSDFLVVKASSAYFDRMKSGEKQLEPA